MLKKILCVLSVVLLVSCESNYTAKAAVNTGPEISAQTKECLKGYGVSYAQLAEQFSLFQSSLKQDDPHQAALLIHYPLRVNSGKNKQIVSQSIKNSAQLIMQWPNLMNSDVKKKILETNAQDSNQMICNYQGIGFANGLVWFFADKSAQIFVINN